MTREQPTKAGRVQHCWADLRDTLEVGSDAWCLTYDDDHGNATCMLESGHDGPHEWTPDDQIGVTFNV